MRIFSESGKQSLSRLPSHLYLVSNTFDNDSQKAFMNSKGRKAVWSLESKKGLRCLHKDFHDMERCSCLIKAIANYSATPKKLEAPFLKHCPEFSHLRQGKNRCARDEEVQPGKTVTLFSSQRADFEIRKIIFIQLEVSWKAVVKVRALFYVLSSLVFEFSHLYGPSTNTR